MPKNSQQQSSTAAGQQQQTTIANQQQADPNLPVAAAVAVKLPDFWETDPSMWFAQAEAQFALAGVVQDGTMFNHIIAKLNQSVMTNVADLIKTPPAANKYDALKQRLIKRYELSAQSKLEKLLGSCDLGDLRPTHLLAKMQELSSGLNVDDELLKMLFLQRLPASIRPVLSINDGSLLKLAEMADKMIDIVPQAAAVKVPTHDNTQENLADQIAALTAEIRRLKARPERNRSRTRSASRNRNRDRSNEAICWYHRKYASRAERCRSPCQFHKSKN